jgi:peroxiredoxin
MHQASWRDCDAILKAGVFFLVGSLSRGAGAGEPAVVLSPTKPISGETLRVTYNPTAAGAKLGVEGGVYVLTWAVYSDGWHQHEAYPASRVEDRFVCEIPIREALCQLSVHIANRFGVLDSPEVLSKLPVYRPDGQPVRHAYASQMDDAEYEAARALFDKEMALYPDNYYAYFNWWSALERHAPREYETELTNSLRQIERTVKGTPLDYQFVRVAAYLDLRKEEPARQIVLDMLKEAPNARFTHFATRLYRHRTYAEGTTGTGPAQVSAAIVSAVQAHPTSPLARIGLDEYLYEEEFPAKALRAIASAWLSDDPLNSLPYYALAVAAEREEQTQMAYDAVRRAIDLTLTANLHLPESFAASQQEMVLPGMYRLWGKTALALDKPAEALAAAKAAASLVDGESSGRAEELEGKIWASWGSTDSAERAFMSAHLRSAERGRDGLRKLYVRAHGSEDGFDAHFASLLEAGLKNSLVPAPAFDVTTIDGKSLTAAALRGKVVVLNFWYIGCAPCQREIPELNRTVAAFAGRDDVVFLAPTSDKRERLVPFLSEHELKYQVVPDAAALNIVFEVRGHPTHIVIDRKGRVVWRSAGDLTFAELKPMIDRALALGGQ